MAGYVAATSKADARSIVDTLVATGFAMPSMEITPDRTSIGYDADADHFLGADPGLLHRRPDQPGRLPQRTRASAGDRPLPGRGDPRHHLVARDPPFGYP